MMVRLVGGQSSCREALVVQRSVCVCLFVCVFVVILLVQKTSEFLVMCSAHLRTKTATKTSDQNLEFSR